MSEKILVIDDERDIANLLEVYLQNENYIVYKYYCAKDAMPCIENEDIDLAKYEFVTDTDCYFAGRIIVCSGLCLLHTFPVCKMQRRFDSAADCYCRSPYSYFCLHSVGCKLDFSYFAICGTWYAKQFSVSAYQF